ncbi:MAG: glycosyltransferase [Oscillospiraceae bacterium]|nr:glycosyltransferase [Oscillospiraceae bacterium]
MIQAETVSIIVPVYRVEAYLEACVDSLLRQTYQNIEVILVDDGSPDRCGEMCDAYVAKDSRVKVIHQVNGGLSLARNAGIQAISGLYFGFVDSDDVVSEHYVASLVGMMQESHAEVGACAVADFRDGQEPALTARGAQTTLDPKEALRMFFYQDRMQTNVLGKLFHRSLLRENMFEPGILYEDAEPMYRILLAANRVAWTDAVLAGYRHRMTAQSKQQFTTREMDCVCVWQRVYQDVLNRCSELEKAAACRVFSAYSHIFYMIPTHIFPEETKCVWKLMKQHRVTVLFDRDARKKARAAALLSYLGQGAMRKLGAYLLARENRKLFKEQK